MHYTFVFFNVNVHEGSGAVCESPERCTSDIGSVSQYASVITIQLREFCFLFECIFVSAFPNHYPKVKLPPWRLLAVCNQDWAPREQSGQDCCQFPH
jgi:hypothetical protein